MRSDGHLPSRGLPGSSCALVTTLAWTMNERLSTVAEPDDDELTILSWMLAGAIAVPLRQRCNNDVDGTATSRA